jgi:hypothetical protein
VEIFVIGLILNLQCSTAFLNKKTSATVEVAARTGLKKASAANFDNGKDQHFAPADLSFNNTTTLFLLQRLYSV